MSVVPTLQGLWLLLMMLIVALEVSGDCLWNLSVDVPTVDCRLRILDFRRNSSASVPGLKAVQALNVECSDVFFFESQLRSDHFGPLEQLQELNIKYCKIRHLPPRSFVGLSKLKRLKINTFNADWTNLSLEPDYETFVGLEHLAELDLTNNNIIKLPPNLFCPLKHVQLVNLSKNSLQDLEHLGMGSRSDSNCQIPMQSLILSHNEVSSVPPGSLTLLKTLKHLDLSFNAIGVLVESTFDELRDLISLDLSHNQLVSLPPQIFSLTSKMKELNLANNSIGTIDLNAFANLTDLQVLNLSGNSLDENWIKPGIFTGLSGLIVLDLASNHISKVESKLFSDLGALQMLNLAHNQIHTLASNAFSGQLNLHILLLSHNELESLHHQTLNGLSVLNSLALDNNKLHSLHQEALQNCTSLRELSLSNNLLTQVPKALHHMAALTTLDLSQNVIGFLKRESLQGLPKLTALKIGKNELSRIGEGAFKEAPELKHLDLGGNRFQKLGQETFRALKKLESLNLAENELEDVNGLLQTQIHLKWLNISNNHLAWFDYAFVPPSVQWLDVHSNEIDALGNYYNLEGNFKLKFLDASHNKISDVGPENILGSMEHLYLNDNKISKIAPNSFLDKERLEQVHLQRNELSTLSRAALHITPQENPPLFFLAENPFVCNCHLQWLRHVNSRVLSRHPQVMDMDKISCSVLNHTNHVTRKRIGQVSDDDFLCKYEKHCLADCMCCDFFACDCQMKCPDGCTCFHDQNWSANIIQCSGADFQDIPKVIPMDTTALYLDDNNLRELKPGFLLGRTRLRKLSISNSRVATINNQSFAGLSDLRILNLGYNQLQKLVGHEFSYLTGLRELNLRHNQLVSMHEDTFKHLKKLQTLHLDGNLLISFPIWQLSSNAKLNHLTLAHNWWQCDCDFVRKFRMFIDGNIDIIGDAKDITCTSSETSQSDQDQCSNILGGSSGGFHFQKTFGNNFLPLVIGFSVLLVAVVVVVVAMIKTRETFLIWLHAKHGIRLTTRKEGAVDSEKESEVLFDALILYSLKDEKFVTDDLIKPIHKSYKLCLIHRDLSGIYTSEAFKSALAASKRHIIVLSQGFFTTEWDYVKDLMLSNCIVILANDVTKAEIGMNKEANEMVRTCRKVLKFRDPGFWRKFRYHLPEPSNPSTKEGGAELDVSGIWTFTSMDDGINESGVSTTKLFSTPKPTPESPKILFPAPPIKKQPHQCSTHYLAGAPSCQHLENSQDSSTALLPSTRSCGTNISHQRSSSAVMAKATAIHHPRSKSSVVDMTGTESIPTPPPKMRNRHSVYNVNRPAEPIYRPTEPVYNIPPANTMLSRLLATNPNQELLHRLPPIGQAASTESQVPTSSLALIPLRASGGRFHHQRSTSLLDKQSQPVSHYTKHGRSTSTLAPAGVAAQLQQQRTSGVTRTTSMLLNNPAQIQVKRSLLHNRSTMNLVTKAESPPTRPIHSRSRSTPYEGFVL